MQQNETTLQVVCSNPDLVIENNFSDTFLQPGKVVKELKYLSKKFKIKDFRCNGSMSWILTEDGELWGTGYNGGDAFGFLSVNNTSRQRGWSRKATNVKSFHSTNNNTFYILNNGDMYCCGKNYYGQMGYGSSGSSSRSKFARRATNVKFATTDGCRSYYISNDGTVYAAGEGSYGTITANADRNSITTWVKSIDASKKVRYITSSDDDYAFYIDENNDLYGIGKHYHGALGLGSTSSSAWVKDWKYIASNVKIVYTGNGNSWYLTYDGELYTTGRAGQDGVAEARSKFTLTKTGVKDIYTDHDWSYGTYYYILENGDLYAAGYTRYGSFGTGSTTSKQYTTPIKIASNVVKVSGNYNGTAYLDINGDWYVAGGDSGMYCWDAACTSGLTKFTKAYHPSQNVWTENGEKQSPSNYGLTITGTPALNDTLTLTFNTKVLAPPMETRLTVNASNEFLQVINNYKGSQSEPGIVSCDLTYGLGFDKVQQAKVFDEGICYIDSYGDLYFKGNFKYGSSGDGTIEDVLYEEETKKASNVKKVGGSSVNTFYINKQNELYVCGQNTYGQLGVGTTQDVLEFTKIADNVKDAVLYETLMYITQDNDLYVCGRNDLGQLGIGNTANISTPHKVAINVDYISADAESTWYISRGELYGTGYNANGKQGSGDTQNVLTFTKRAENVKMVAASDDSVQYITNEGELYCAGQTKNNEMFNGVIEEGIYTKFTKCNENIKYLYLGSNIRYYVKDNGNLYVVGNNINGEYGDAQTTPDTPEAGTTPVLVAQDVERAGYCHYYDINGHLFMCGDNTYGQIIKDEPVAQTYSLRRSVSADSLLPWTDVTKTEIGWTNENNEIINLDDINIEVQGEPEEGDKLSLTFNTRRLIPVGLDVAHGDRVGFRFVTAEQYDQLLKDELVTGNLIYAITDGKTLLMGNKPYSINNKFVEEYPKYPAQGVIYFNTTTQGVKMYNGAEWTSLVPDIRTSMDQVELDEDLLTAKAIKDFIDPQINESLVADVTYDNLQNIFTVTSIDGNTKQLALRNIISSITYENNTFTFNKLGTEDVITLPEENYLIDANFDGRTLHLILKGGAIISVDLLSLLNIFTEAETNSAIATINDDTLQIDVKLSSQNGNGILDVDGLYVPKHLIHSASNTSSVSLDITDNKLTGHINVSQAEGNSLILNEDGLYTNTVPIDLYYDKIQLDELLDARKDKQEFVQEIDLKIEPHLVYEKEQQYNITEMDDHKAWRTI